MLTQIIPLFVIAILIIQWAYELLLYLAFHKKEKIAKINNTEPISIISCAKNEAQNIAALLEALQAQSYSTADHALNFEVLVIDDGSTDATWSILENAIRHFPQLRIFKSETFESTFKGKKKALEIGVTQAKHDAILCIDADCIPTSKHWVSIMANALQNKELITGFGAYQKEKSWINTLVQWETMHTFFWYQLLSKIGVYYMAVGRNMGFRKALFLKANQHPLWQQVPYGDDDLLVRIAATSQNYAVVRNPHSYTLSKAPESFQQWMQQKKRHLSTGKYYHKKVQILLGTYALTQGLWWICLLFLSVFCSPLIQCLLVARLITHLFILSAFQKQQGLSISLFKNLLGEFLWAIYNCIFAPYIFFKNYQSWKS